MRNLFLWYIPQAALFALGFWFATATDTPDWQTSGLAKVVFGVALAAAYTGAANLIINTSARIRRRRSRAGSQ